MDVKGVGLILVLMALATCSSSNSGPNGSGGGPGGTGGVGGGPGGAGGDTRCAAGKMAIYPQGCGPDAGFVCLNQGSGGAVAGYYCGCNGTTFGDYRYGVTSMPWAYGYGGGMPFADGGCDPNDPSYGSR